MRLLRNLKHWVVANRFEAMVVASVLLLAVFLRFYQLEAYLHFLGDEGRDLRIVRNMVVSGKPTFLGPTASVGGFYLGPIYYYFITPWLILSGFSPIGPAWMVACMSLVTLVLVYWLTRTISGAFGAICAMLLMTVSPLIVRHSRFSWNPNPVPLFSLLTFVPLWFGNRHWMWFVLSGAALGVNVQLHYLTVILGPLVGIAILWLYPRRRWLPAFLFVAAGFCITMFPFLAFEIYHRFPNFRTISEFVLKQSGVTQFSPWDIVRQFHAVGQRLYELVLPNPYLILSTIFFWVSLIGLVVKERLNSGEHQRLLRIVLLWVVGGIAGLSLYKGTLHPYYFAFLFPLPFILIGCLLGEISKLKVLRVLSAALVIGLLYFMLQPSFPKDRGLASLYLWHPPQHIVKQTRDIADFVLLQTSGRPYNFALMAEQNTDHAYRYFLELRGRPPTTILNPTIDPERKSVTDQLLVVCEAVECKPLGRPLWEIAGFGRGEIVGEWDMIGGIKVFKLVHYQENISR